MDHIRLEVPNNTGISIGKFDHGWQFITQFLIQFLRLAAISKAVGPGVPIVLHGTHPVSDELFHKAVECGVVKVNLNRNVRDDYTVFVNLNWSKNELTKLKEKAVEVYTTSIERAMDMLGSSGKSVWDSKRDTSNYRLDSVYNM